MTKEGRPVYIHALNKLDIKYATSKKLIEAEAYYYLLHERIMKVIFIESSRAAGKRIDQMFVIYDLRKISVWDIFTKVIF